MAYMLASAGIAKISSPKEEAKLRGHQAYATLYAFVTVVRPPLTLRRGEAGHIEDEVVHGWKKVRALAR